MVIRKAKTKWGRYFVCSQGGHDGNCKGTGCTVYADVLEEYMLNAIRDKLSEFKKLSYEKENQSTPKVSKNKIRLAQIDEEIGDLLSKVGSANSILMKYINDKVSELDAERQTLQEEIVSLTCSKTESKMGQITDHVKKWQDISFEDKQAVVDALIKVIKVANGNIEITWKI